MPKFTAPDRAALTSVCGQSRTLQVPRIVSPLSVESRHNTMPAKMSASTYGSPKAAGPVSANLGHGRFAPIAAGPPNAAVLESGRHAGEALSTTMGGKRKFASHWEFDQK